MIEPSCPACQGARFTRALETDSATIWRCVDCGLGETRPQPQEADGRESFSEDEGCFERAYAEYKDRWWHRFMDAPLDLIERVGARPGMRLLDMGCSLGYLVAKARERGYDARGFDGSSAAVTFGRERLGLDLACARMDTVHIVPASQDIVVINHVLEHLPNPITTLRTIREWLRPGGFLLIGLPNFASPIACLAGHRWAGLVPTQHIWHFTPKALTRLVGRGGFIPARWTTRMLTYRPTGFSGWLKWTARWALESIGQADNLIFVVRPSGGRDPE